MVKLQQFTLFTGDEIAEPENISKIMEEIVFASEGDYCLPNIIIICLSTPPLNRKKKTRSKAYYMLGKKVWMDVSFTVHNIKLVLEFEFL